MASIKKLLLQNMLFITFISFTSLYSFWVLNEYTKFNEESETIKEKFVTSEKERLKTQVQAVLEYVQYMRNQTEKRLRGSIKGRVNEACAIAFSIYTENKDSKSRDEIKKMIKDALRPIRFNQNRGYYFAFNMEGIEELFADRPEMEGKNMMAVQGAKGEYVVPDMIEIIKAHKEGFYSYTWSKPGDLDAKYLKIAYVKYFEPYGWGIGTGEYLEDVKKEIQEEVLERISKLRFEKEGYFFGSIYGGHPLFTNGKITAGTKNVWELTDPKGIKIIQEQNRVAKEPGGGFVSYFWQKLNSQELSPKLSYVVGIPEWEWLIGAGVYLDTMDEVILSKKKTLYHDFLKQAVLYFAVMIFMFFLIFLWTRYQAHKIQSGIRLFSNFFKTASSQATTIDLDGLQFEEFKSIAVSANQMIETRTESIQALRKSEEDLKESQRIAHVGSWRLNLESNQVVWSEELYKMYGFNPEFPPPPYTEHKTLFTSESWEKLSSALDNTRDTGIPYELELETLRQDGSHGWMWVCGEAISDGSGRIVGLRGAAQEITERKHAEEKLYKSKETLRAIFNASPLAIVLIDKSGNIIDSNEAHANRLNMKRSQTLGKCLWNILPESVRAHRKMQVESVFETGEPFTGEDKRGMIWSEYYIHPAIKNKNGEIEAVIVEALDITERKKAEESLKESKIFLEKMSDIAYMADNKGNLTWVNSAVERITGLSVDEITGKSFLPLFVEKDHVSLKDVYKRTLMGDSLENILTFTSGVTCHFTSLPKRNDKGEIIGTFGVARDITERLIAEKTLQISEDRLKKAQAVAKIGNWEYDISTGRVWGSEEAFRIYGIEQSTPFLPLNEVENCIIEAKRVNQSLVDLITKNVAYDIEFEIKPVNSDGIKVIHSIADLVCDDNGNPLIVTGVIQDITESKTREKDRQRLRTQLQQAQKMESIGTLAGGIAHDFNNILFPIVGHAEMLLEDVPDDSPYRESINEIYTGSLRARDLVHQILAFSRQGSSELKLMKMQSVIKEALKLIRSTIPTTISINQNIQPNCGAVKADPTQIHQIVMNLATNAYHAMEETQGELKVSLKEIELGPYDFINPDMEPGSYACLTIADTGTGMDKKTIDKIFDPFFTTKGKGKGTGMGLSVVHGIVKNMNGEIQVYSEPGKGTEFHVYLPVVKIITAKEQIQTDGPILGGTESVLLVDDEEGIIAMEKQALERLGYHVTSRISSLEALEAFRANPDKFDLIITDKAMPNMPGEKLAVELIKIRPDIPILLCTGFSESMSEEKIKSMGIKGLLLKPIIMRDLAKKIREILD